MSRYIDADLTIQNAQRLPVIGAHVEHVLTNPKLAPTADVKPVVYGKWLKEMNFNYSPFDGTDGYTYTCDRCGTRCLHKSNFCPNCGADMRGIKDENNN